VIRGERPGTGARPRSLTYTSGVSIRVNEKYSRENTIMLSVSNPQGEYKVFPRKFFDKASVAFHLEMRSEVEGKRPLRSGVVRPGDML